MLSRFLIWFALILLVLAAGVTIAEMLLHLDDLAADTEGFGGAIRFLALRVCSYYLPILIPISSFTATFMSLGLASRWMEVTAAKAGGISPLRAAVPLLAAAAVLSGVTLLVNETMVIESERAWRRHLSGSKGEIKFRRGSFWYASGRYIYNVGDADPNTRTLHDLRIFEINEEGRLVRRIHASVARLLEGGLHVFDATEFRFDPASPLAPPERNWSGELTLHTDSPSDTTLLAADAATLSLRNLSELIAQRARRGGEVARFRAMLHARLTDPLTVFLLALLAVPFALRVEQTRSLAVPALQGVIVLLAFWSFRSGGAFVAASGPVAAVAAPWSVLLAFAAAGAWRFARVPT
jgi:lipopolysaccharide export system permease protein